MEREVQLGFGNLIETTTFFLKISGKKYCQNQCLFFVEIRYAGLLLTQNLFDGTFDKSQHFQLEKKNDSGTFGSCHLVHACCIMKYFTLQWNFIARHGFHALIWVCDWLSYIYQNQPLWSFGNLWKLCGEEIHFSWGRGIRSSIQGTISTGFWKPKHSLVRYTRRAY